MAGFISTKQTFKQSRMGNITCGCFIEFIESTIKMICLSLLFDYSGLFSSLEKVYKGYQGVLGKDYNAILTVTERSGTPIRDPDTGNYILPDETKLDIYAFLTQKKDPNIEGDYAGLNLSRFYLEGFLVSPLSYNYPFSQRTPCLIIQDSRQTQGYFTVLDHYPQSMDETTQIRTALGQKICGYFETGEPMGA